MVRILLLKIAIRFLIETLYIHMHAIDSLDPFNLFFRSYEVIKYSGISFAGELIYIGNAIDNVNVT